MLLSVLALLAFQSQSAASSPLDFGTRVRAVTAPIHHAGVYHLPSGVRTPMSSLGATSSDVIYNNTCPSASFIIAALQAGESLTDEGRVPSPSGPTGPTIRKPGCSTNYLVNGFEIAYC